MTETHAPLTMDAGEQTLSVLEQHIEGFVDAWCEAQAPPALDRFLPPSGELRRYTLIELIKIDLEYRWQEHNLPRHIEDYLADFPELAEGGIPADLIYEEFHLRQNCGLRVDPEDYVEKFPEQAEELRRLLGLQDPYQSTKIVDGGQKRVLDEIEVGQTLDDFELLAPLGRGAFARVFLARQQSMQRMVALKVSADSGTEPQTLAQMDHDHIVRVFDQRGLPDQKVRLLYMQYVAGGTLQAAIQLYRETPPEERTGRLLLRAVDRSLDDRGEVRPTESLTIDRLKGCTWGEAVCWVGARLAQALDYAHGRGILHRDVKPANVLLTHEGSPKLADFNISFSSQVSGATPAAYFGGSLAYMSPEQLQASNPAHERQPDSLDGRSDLYSLGVLLWELLTGERPFRDEQVSGGWSKTLEEMAARRFAGIPAEATDSVPPDCPPGLIRVLEGCLEPLPEDRWQTGKQLAQQLELCQKPHAETLLYPEHGSPCQRMRSWMIPLIFLAAAVPNILAGLFNLYYNKTELIPHLPPTSQQAFWDIQMVINALCYPVGLGTLMILARPVIRRAASGPSAEPPAGDEESTSRLRRRSLRLGHYAALLSIALWSLAGIAYPAALHMTAGVMPAANYPHFFGSLLLCGLVAAVYPFFLTSALCLRVPYPCLLQQDLSAARDVQPLRQLKRLTGAYLVLAMMVPMLGVAALTAINPDARYAMGVFIGCGLVGLGLVFLLFRQLQLDLDALIDAIEPG